MAKSLSNKEIPLLDLLIEENNKIPDREGNTPLILKAIEISQMENLSKDREYYENEVCKLSQHFKSFNQTHFAELDSFINISTLPRPNILNSFTKFIKANETTEDISLKGCVARFILNYNKSFFQLDYLKERFSELKTIDPWLYSEIIIKYKWEEGVSFISEILSNNKDTSYLFALIAKWMTEDGNETQLEYAFEKWVTYFSNDDKELLKIFCEQYGFKQNKIDFKPNYEVKKLTKEMPQLKVLNNFGKACSPLKFESLTP